MAKTTQTKSDFVRALPRTMPAAEVVKKASTAGLKLSTAYVYVIRSKAGAKKSGRKATTGSARSNGSSLDKQFVNLALDMGFARAQSLLDSARSKARQALS